MTLRRLQILLAVENCLFGAFLLAHFGRALFAIRAWPPSHEQTALLLIAAVLPLALLDLAFPSIAGILQFACACVGSHQLMAISSPPALLLSARISMGVALVMLAVAAASGVIGITPELFESPPAPDQKPQKQHPPRRAA